MVAIASLVVLLGSSARQWALDTGTKVSCVFVQPSQKQAWRTSGELISYASLPKPTTPVWTGKEDAPLFLAFTHAPTGRAEAPTVRFKLPSTDELNASFSSKTNVPGIWISGLKPPPGQPQMQDISVGIAEGPWKVINWIEFRKAGNGLHAVKQHGIPIKLSVNGTGPRHTAQHYTFLHVPERQNFGNAAYRFVVQTTAGQNMPFSDSFRSPGQDGVMLYRFEGDVRDVGRVELQTRRFDWHTVRVAHFRPDSQ